MKIYSKMCDGPYQLRPNMLSSGEKLACKKIAIEMET